MEDREDEIREAWDDPMLCRALWLSVIAQAMVDAKSKASKPEERRARCEALAWFGQHAEDSDFVETCDLAGVCPKEVREILKKVRRGERKVDFRCLRKVKLTNRLIIRKLDNSTPNKGENHGNS